MRLILIMLLLLTAPALASDGVLEINQTCAVETGCFSGDTAGFPVTISASGSYRLTGNLDLNAEGVNVSGVAVSAPAVTIDLGGFQIVGPTQSDRVSLVVNASFHNRLIENSLQHLAAQGVGAVDRQQHQRPIPALLTSGGCKGGPAIW